MRQAIKKFPPFLLSLAGLAVGASAATVFCVISSAFKDGFLPDADSLAFELLAGFALLFGASLPFGFLAHAVLYGLKWRSLAAYGLAAAAEVFLCGAVTTFGRMLDIEIRETLIDVVAAVLCAIIAWMIRRPDRDAPPISESHKDSAIIF